MQSKIKILRTALKLSTSELALRLGVSQSTVVRLERSEAQGTISLNTLQKISNALGCHFEYELKPKAKRAVRKKYHGLRRSAQISYKIGSLSEQMKNENRMQSAAMTPEERILQACELSDFSRQLK